MISVSVAVIAVGICALIGTISGFPVSQWISERMTSFFLGFSSEKFDKPQPLIGNAAAKAIKGDVLGATQDFETMLKEHPQNAELYLRLMELAYGPLQKPEYGDKLIARAKKKIRNEKDLKSLIRLGTALKEGNLITHKHLGWMSNMEQGIQPPLLHLGDAAVVSRSKKK